MNICQNCLSTCDEGKNLPIYSIGWGTAGALAGISLGAPVLIPLGLIAGILVDVERCSWCGSSSNDSNPIFKPMKNQQDDTGNHNFVPHSISKQPEAVKEPRRNSVLSNPFSKKASTPEQKTTCDNKHYNIEKNELLQTNGSEQENYSDDERQYTWNESLAKFVPSNNDQEHFFSGINNNTGTEEWNSAGINNIADVNEFPAPEADFGYIDEEINNIDPFDEMSDDNPMFEDFDIGFDYI